jgi:6-hydroxycyclohex-1-ene-1-carbonyl-CoA dehydrogenase
MQPTGREWTAWMMTAPGAPLERRTREPQPPGAGEAVVAVAGCGVCHTDASFLFHGVRTRAPLPLTLGHEISGSVQQVGAGVDEALLGAAVVVPAVLPCGECELCTAGFRTICRRQIMPGNDRHGGFASHVVAPARFLCRVPPSALQTHELWELAVVSDAVSTPFQAVRRAHVAAGDLAIFVGVGGIGVHGVQVAAAIGATVIAIDVNDRKLALSAGAGARATLNVRDVPPKEIRKLVRAHADSLGAPAHRWKIFETSGTRTGQETAYSLLGFGSSLSIVGFTMDRVEICLSNLMAYDAVAMGNWGADPLVYPELLDWIGAGRLRVKPYVEQHSLEKINDVLRQAEAGALERRAVLTPG